MPLEIEAKFRVDSHEDVRARLREAGAEPLGSVIETNVIFDCPDGSLRGAGCGLRLRSTTGEDGTPVHATLTFKGPQQPGPLKVREEIDVGLDDAAGMELILASCGLQTILWYQKRRESWRLGDCRIELDEPPHLGWFIEIEGPNEAAIGAVQRQLRLGHLAHEPRSYVHLLLGHCQVQGIAPRLPLET